MAFAACDFGTQERRDLWPLESQGSHQLPANALVKRLLEDLAEFSLTRPRLDDLTVMAIEMIGHSPPNDPGPLKFSLRP